MGYSPLLLLARGLLVVIIIIRPVLTFLVPRSTLGWLQYYALEIVLARLFTLEHIYLCLGYHLPTLINQPSSPYQHWPPSYMNTYSYTCSHAQATTLHGASVFMFSSSLSYDIETRDVWPWNHIRALRMALPVFSFITWSDIMAKHTVQVVERLDGCDPYFRRSITHHSYSAFQVSRHNTIPYTSNET